MFDVKVYWWSNQSEYLVSATQASIGSVTPGHIFGEFHFYKAGTNQEVSFSGMCYVNYLQKENQVQISNAAGYWFTSDTAMSLQSNNFLKNTKQITPTSFHDTRCCSWVAFDSSPSNPMQFCYYNGTTGHNTAIYGNGINIDYKIASSSDYNSNSSINTVKITKNGSYTVIDPHEEVFGYSFDGWYSDMALSQKATYYTMLSSNTTLYGKYTKLYGELSIQLSSKSQTSKDLTGGIYELYNADSPSTLLGTFTTSSDGASNVIANLPYGTYIIKEKTPPNGFVPQSLPTSITLSAAQAVIDIEVSPYIEIVLKDSMDDHVIASSTVPFQSKYLLPALPEKHGYEFREWNTSPDGNGHTIDQSSFDSVSTDIHAYAIYVPTPLAVSKTIAPSETADGNIVPNEYVLSMSADGDTWINNKHLIFVMDRTGSLTQPVYDQVANSVISLSKELVSTGNVKVSCVLFAGSCLNPTSPYYDGYHIPFIDSQDPSDFEKLRVPVSTTASGVVNGIDYSGEQNGGTSWHSGFLGLEDVMEAITSDNDKVDIVFFSDSMPNAHVNDAGQCGTDWDRNKARSKAQEALSRVLETYEGRISSFSSIGLDIAGGTLDGMEEFHEELTSPYADIMNTEYIRTSDATSTSSQIKFTVEKNIIAGHLSNVRIEDALSDNVVPLAFDGTNHPVVSACIENTATKEKITLSDNSDYVFTYDTSTKVVSCLYKHPLPKGQRITMEIGVRLTADAYAKEASDASHDIGQDGTGSTSAGQPGWKSNMGKSDRVLASTPYGDEATGTLPTPVVQASLSELIYDSNAPADQVQGTMESDVLGTGEETIVGDCEYKRYGYRFVGWSETPNGEATLTPGTNITVSSESKTLYAAWKLIEIQMPETGSTSTLAILLTGSVLVLVALGVLRNRIFDTSQGN